LLRWAVPVALTSFHSTDHFKIKGIGSALHSKLRFENKTAEKILKLAWTFFLLFYLFVNAMDLLSKQTISFLENFIRKLT
jgi:hypothetical protein